MKAKLISILERYGKSLEDKLKTYILQYIINCAPAHFKILPKVHKRPLVGRLIVASTKYLTTPASRFVDYILSPCLPSLPSYLKDSSDIIQDLSGFSMAPGSYLVTADVTSLYTNIPIADSITAVDLFCKSNGCPCTALFSQIIILFSQIIIWGRRHFIPPKMGYYKSRNAEIRNWKLEIRNAETELILLALAGPHWFSRASMPLAS